MPESFDLPYAIPLGKAVNIIAFHPIGLVILDKPEGTLSVPNKPEDFHKTILKAKFKKKDEAYVWFDSAQQQRFFYICHRLDSPTSGLLIGTLNQELAVEIRQLFKTRKIHKEYMAVVSGIPKGQSGQWSDRLKLNKSGGQLRTRVSGGGDEAKADWKIVKQSQNPPLSLLSLKPATGRTHQLRIQTSHRGHGIIGDRTYGDFKLNSRLKKELGITRMLLHAYRITIDADNLLGSPFRFFAESPLPKAFTQLFDNGRSGDTMPRFPKRTA